MTDGTKSTPANVDALARKLQTDPYARLKLLNAVADSLVELGAKHEDLMGMSDFLLGVPTGVPDVELVIVTRSDSKKNTTSIIIFGR